MTFAPQPIEVFCGTLCLSIQQSMLMNVSAKSPGFKKWWFRSLNLNTTITSQSQRTYEAISSAYLHLSFITPMTVYQPQLLNDSALFFSVIIIVCLFLLKLNNYPAPLTEDLRKSLTSLCSQRDCSSQYNYQYHNRYFIWEYLLMR
jgi:hypothetical protein